MFFLTKPNRQAIADFLDGASRSHFSYSDIGASRLDANLKAVGAYIVDHYKVVIGNGESDFAHAKAAVRRWKMFGIPWVDLCWPSTPIEDGQNVAILIRHFGFYSLNAARIVYTIDEDDWFGFAYGTLEDHGESGEERFSVMFDGETGDVTYDLLAFSRPGHPLAKLGYPVTRMLQKRFAADSKRAMLSAVQDNRIN